MGAETKVPAAQKLILLQEHCVQMMGFAGCFFRKTSHMMVV